MDEPILSVRKIHMFFGGLAAIVDLSFDVQAHEVLGVMGPNGAGKSTLLNIISGVYKPALGSIAFMEHNITGLAPHKICHLGIARTFQIPQPFLNLTALQNIIVAAEYGRGIGKAAAKKEALKILDMVQLLAKKDVLVKDLLASVTLKRLELARALATNPSLLLLDETAAGLTEEEIPQLLEILQQIREMGITYILIDHVMKVMKKAVDKIIVMDKGMKIAEGPPNEVMEDRMVIRAYLGEST